MTDHGASARLDALTRELLNRWRQTREHWNDAKAREFEERFIHPLETAVKVTVSGVENLEQTMNKMRRDCE